MFIEEWSSTHEDADVTSFVPNKNTSAASVVSPAYLTNSTSVNCFFVS